MNREEITRLAQEAGFVGMDGEHGGLRRFAALVASAAQAKEREACAKACEDKAERYAERAAKPENERDINRDTARIAQQTCFHLADNIRARGQA